MISKSGSIVPPSHMSLGEVIVFIIGSSIIVIIIELEVCELHPPDEKFTIHLYSYIPAGLLGAL